MKRLFFLIIVFLASQAHAQQSIPPRIHAYLDFTSAAEYQEGTGAFSYVRNWGLGKSRKLELGLGLRWTSYLGNKKEFYTASASLARSSTVPFVNVFSGHEYQNIDTLTRTSGRHQFPERWNIKAVYQFFFTEYNTQSIHQTAPDGTDVYRFRNRANLLGFGVSYEL